VPHLRELPALHEPAAATINLVNSISSPST
jgi:hypothetical protein